MLPTPPYQPPGEVDRDQVLESLNMSVPSLIYNLDQLNRCRVFFALVAGITVGILGLTGFVGFLVFPLSQLGASALIWTRTQQKYQRFFKTWGQFATEGFLSELLTYILAWTVLYNVVHVY